MDVMNEIIKMDDLLFNEVNHFIEQIEKSPIENELSLFQKMESYAQMHHVPIMEKVNRNFISFILKTLSPKRILELGTGIGFSSLFMCNQIKNIEKIETYEVNEVRYNEANKFIEMSNYKNIIHTHLADFKISLENGTLAKAENLFDLIYVDAAKGQYQIIFEALKENLSKNGMFIFDNVFINGWVINLNYPNHRRKHYVLKMRKFLAYLNECDEFISTLIPLSDGILLVKKK